MFLQKIKTNLKVRITINMVPVSGLEPELYCQKQILSTVLIILKLFKNLIKSYFSKYFKLFQRRKIQTQMQIFLIYFEKIPPNSHLKVEIQSQVGFSPPRDFFIIKVGFYSHIKFVCLTFTFNIFFICSIIFFQNNNYYHNLIYLMNHLTCT